MKLLAITNLFGFPWDRSRGMFNQQQFDRIARHVELSVLVAVPWPQALRHPRRYWNARRAGRLQWPYVDYFVFWYVPGIGQFLHSLFFFLSLAVQRPRATFFARRDALLGSWGFPDAVATAMIGAITRTPMVMKVHGTDVNDYLQVPAKRWQILAAARHARAVMSPSRALKARLVDAGVPAEAVSVVYNGVDHQAFRPQSRADARAGLGLGQDERVILYVGNLKASKGCLDLMEAFIRLADAQPRAVLAVVGGGEAQGPMRALAQRAGLAERVRFAGKVPHASLPTWFAAADLLCLPSHNEGVPNVVLEAMACGLPVVATRVGGIPEVLPEFAGELVSVRDVPGIAEAIDKVLASNWACTRIAEHARRFDWDANLSQALEILDRATSRAPQLTPTP